MHPEVALAYARRHRPRFVRELSRFIAYPSISSEPEKAPQVRACASWLAEHLKQVGLADARVIETPGRPLVYAEWRHAPGRPTVLLYGHYDVLPGGTAKSWKTPPFRATIRGDHLYGRGSSDDKGQIFCHIKAIEAYLRSGQPLPVNVKCLFEGEEEIGSPHLGAFLRRHRELLRADVALISDTAMLGPDRPAISYAQRGGLRAEIKICGPKQELHSGRFGGAVHNPIQALCDLLSRLHDARGRVAIPGFYLDVIDWPESERSYMARVGPTDQELLTEATTAHGWGEAGYTLYERTTSRPALTFNGIRGGYSGTGGRSIIPAWASAQLSFRLVPAQNPTTISRLFRQHVARLTPPTVQSFVRTFAPIGPALMDRKHPAVALAAVAYKAGFGRRPVFLRSGGSIPVINLLAETLHVPVVLMGFGLPDSHIHGPNENLHLPTFFRAIDVCIHYLALARSSAFAAAPPARHHEVEGVFV